MPYPSKTGRATILSAAVTQLAHGGLGSMSLRSLAASLSLAPNALYRYFANRSELEAAMSAESTRRFHAALAKGSAAVDSEPDPEPMMAMRRMAAAYICFAREHRHLYEMVMIPCRHSPEGTLAHQDLWSAVVAQVALLSGQIRAPEAAVALWSFLHGITALEAAQVFGEQKPFSAFDFGLNAWLDAAGGGGQDVKRRAAASKESKLAKRRKRSGKP